MQTIDQIDIKGKTVLVREDLNVPFDESGILSTARIDAAISTIKQLQAKGAKLILMSHLGRPKGRDETYSMQPVADCLAQKLQQKVNLFNLGDPVPPLKENALAMLENVRFYPGEKENSETLAKQYAALCDVFVMDAFGVAHRKHASTTGTISFAKSVCMGPLLANELEMINQALLSPQPPTVAIVGGGKVSTKLAVLQNLLKKVDTLILGGALANTFLLAKGHNMGASRVEPDLVAMARQIMTSAQQLKKQLWLPQDVCVASDIESTTTQNKSVDGLSNSDMVFDIGAKSIESLQSVIKEAKTIVWNGPMGVFEKEPFIAGTKALSQLIAQSNAFTLAGGGETIAAIEKFGVEDKLSYISTGGGAFLEVLEGKTLPVVAALKKRLNNNNEVSV